MFWTCLSNDSGDSISVVCLIPVTDQTRLQSGILGHDVSHSRSKFGRVRNGLLLENIEVKILGLFAVRN